MPILPRRMSSPGRKTGYDAVMARLGKALVSVDARLPSDLVTEALLSGRLTAFGHPRAVVREKIVGESRLDLYLEGPNPWYIETKSATLVNPGGIALFPDAPTLRGAGQLSTLRKLQRGRARAAVIFVIQLPDAIGFSTHEAADPVFATELRKAADASIGVYVYICRVTPAEVTLDREVAGIL